MWRARRYPIVGSVATPLDESPGPRKGGDRKVQRRAGFRRWRLGSPRTGDRASQRRGFRTRLMASVFGVAIVLFAALDVVLVLRLTRDDTAAPIGVVPEGITRDLDTSTDQAGDEAPDDRTELGATTLPVDRGDRETQSNDRPRDREASEPARTGSGDGTATTAPSTSGSTSGGDSGSTAQPSPQPNPEPSPEPEPSPAPSDSDGSGPGGSGPGGGGDDGGGSDDGGGGGGGG